MTSEFVQISFDKIIQTRAYTAVILKEKEIKFAIFSDPSVGRFLQMHLGEEARPRPLSHDLMSMVFQALSIKVKQVVISDFQETVFFAKLFLEQEKDGLVHIAEIDARPSDCIILAFLSNAPVFCSRQVLSRVVPFLD